MTNPVALGLAALIVAALVADYLLFDQAALIFVARKGIELIQYIAIWR